MARRVGCAVLLFLLLLGALGAALIWLVLSLVGAVGSASVSRPVSGGALVLVVLGIVAGSVALRRAGARAGRLVEAARRVERGDYTARVPVRGPSELRSLARAFNAMSARLEADEARRRSVVADVAHELRTPITVIRGQAEGMIDGVYDSDAEHLGTVLKATRSLEVLVEDLRTLALAEAGALQLHREPVEVAALVHDILDTFRDAAAAAGIALAGEVRPPALSFLVDPVRMRSVIANLVGNAIRHGHPGGTVQVDAAARDSTVILVVRDDGEGIAADLLPRVFDRFVKDPASEGSGLGLAIVRDVVEAHGGTVSATSSPGQGTEVTVTLPDAGVAG